MTSQSSPDVDYYTGDNAPLDTTDITSQTNTQNMDSQTDHSGEISGQGNYYSDNVTSGTASSTSQVELDPTSNAPLDVLDSSSQAHIENPNTQEDSRSGSGDDTIGDIVNQIEDDSSSTGTSTADDGDDSSTDGSSYEKDHSDGSLSVDSTLVDQTDISSQSTNSNIDNPKYHADGSGDQVVNNRDSNGSSTTDELDSDYNSESVDDVDGISQSSDSNIDNPKYYDGETTGQVVNNGDSDINSSGSSMSDEGSEDEYYSDEYYSESGDEIDATAANEGSKIDSYYELLDDQVDSSSQSINSNIDTSKNYDGETTGQVGYTGNSDINSNGSSLSDEGSEDEYDSDEYYSDEYYSDSGDERDATSANEGSNIDSYHEPMDGTVDSSSESINSNIDTSKHYDGETAGQVGYNVDSDTNINGSSISDEGSDNEYYSESGDERDATTSNEGSDDEYYSESGDERDAT